MNPVLVLRLFKWNAQIQAIVFAKTAFYHPLTSDSRFRNQNDILSQWKIYSFLYALLPKLDDQQCVFLSHFD